MTGLTFRIIFSAALVSILLGPVGLWFTRRLNLIDFPRSAPHKVHSNPVPLAGGLVLLLTVILAGLYTQVVMLPAVWPILLPAGVVFLFGLWDDYVGLSALMKLTGQTLAAILLVFLGVQIRLFDQMPWMNLVATILWLVGITNAYNFVDSMDGLAAGLAGITAAFFVLVTYESQQAQLSYVSALLLGSLVGVFYFTNAPARFFLGDSGSQMIGFILAALAIAYNPLGYLRLQSWFIPILLVGVPLFDTGLVIFSRLRRRKPVYQSGLDHTYHRLVELGLDPLRAVLTMHVTALLLGCLAFIALSLPPVWANTIFGICLVTGLILILWMDNRQKRL